jgi:hypothetical protein
MKQTKEMGAIAAMLDKVDYVFRFTAVSLTVPKPTGTRKTFLLSFCEYCLPVFGQ